MKNIILKLSSAALFAALLFPACKKGEGDPFLSLRCRKARATGEWKMTAGTGSDTYTSGGNTTVTTTTYDGANRTESVSFNSGTPVVTTSAYTQSLTINKDGSFTLVELDDTVTTTITGKWNFTSGVGKDSKKKERLVLYYEKIDSGGGNVMTIDGNLFIAVFEIYQLKSKEMILKFDYSNSDANSSDTTTNEWTFTQ